MAHACGTMCPTFFTVVLTALSWYTQPPSMPAMMATITAVAMACSCERDQVPMITATAATLIPKNKITRKTLAGLPQCTRNNTNPTKINPIAMVTAVTIMLAI
jgi:hypothetical protein